MWKGMNKSLGAWVSRKGKRLALNVEKILWCDALWIRVEVWYLFIIKDVMCNYHILHEEWSRLRFLQNTHIKKKKKRVLIANLFRNSKYFSFFFLEALLLCLDFWFHSNDLKSNYANMEMLLFFCSEAMKTSWMSNGCFIGLSAAQSAKGSTV